MLAAIFHILITLSVYTLGRSSLSSSTFDTNGIAVSFAPDGIEFQREAAQLSDVLASGQLRAWLDAPSPFHVKLYSICFTVLGPLFGATILSAEPLNLFFYLAILVLVFYLGKEVLDRRTGLVAAATVAMWPTFVLHTTQLLRDPAFIAGMLAFVLINLRFLSPKLFPAPGSADCCSGWPGRGFHLARTRQPGCIAYRHSFVDGGHAYGPTVFPEASARGKLFRNGTLNYPECWCYSSRA